MKNKGSSAFVVPKRPHHQRRTHQTGKLALRSLCVAVGHGSVYRAACSRITTSACSHRRCVLLKKQKEKKEMKVKFAPAKEIWKQNKAMQKAELKDKKERPGKGTCRSLLGYYRQKLTAGYFPMRMRTSLCRQAGWS